MFRESGDARTNFVLFSYAGKFLKEQSVRVGDINNIWLLIPLGTGLYRWFQKKWVLLIPFVMSVAIETTQYITGLGIAEFDDVFGNTMGGWIGILVAYIIMMWRSEMVDPMKISSASSSFDQSRYCPHRWQYPWYSRSMQTSHLGQTENMFLSR